MKRIVNMPGLLAVAAFCICFLASGSHAQDFDALDEDFSAPDDLADFPGEDFNEMATQPSSPNKWNLKDSILTDRQTEMRVIESRIPAMRQELEGLAIHYQELRQRYADKARQYQVLEQRYNAGMITLQQMMARGQQQEIQGQQLMTAAAQAQQACMFGNPYGCNQLRHLQMQYARLRSEYQELFARFQQQRAQLDQFSQDGAQLQRDGVQINRSASETQRRYESILRDMQSKISRYQKLKIEVALAIADGRKTGVDFKRVAGRLKKIQGMSDLSEDALETGLKAGVGAGFISDEEVESMKGELKDTISAASTIAKTTAQLLKEVGLVK
jgi:DNA repair exonuclease SbcCD ATPase subunit